MTAAPVAPAATLAEMIVGRVACAIVLVSACACTPEHHDEGLEGDHCAPNRDECVAPLECLDRTCVVPGGDGAVCVSGLGPDDDGCVDGFVCVREECRVSPPPNCSTDGDCADDEVCADTETCSKACTPRGGAGAFCGSCECEDLECCPSIIPCGAAFDCVIEGEGGDCEPGVCAADLCASDDDCDTGATCQAFDCGHYCAGGAAEDVPCARNFGTCEVRRRCDTGLECGGNALANLTCAPPHGIGESCIPDVPIDDRPVGDDGCDDGLHCAGGVCVEGAPCRTADDCGPNEGCDEGLCHLRACASDADCVGSAAGSACHFHDNGDCGSECVAPAGLHERCVFVSDSFVCDNESVSCDVGLVCAEQPNNTNEVVKTCELP